MGIKREWQSFHILILLTTVFAIITAAFFVLLFCAESMIVSTQLLNQRLELRGAVGLSDAEEALKDILNEHAQKIAQETYEQTVSDLNTPGAPSLSETEALDQYRKLYAEELKRFCSAGRLQEELSEHFHPEKGTVKVDDSAEPDFSREAPPRHAGCYQNASGDGI